MVQRGRLAKCPYCGSQRRPEATYCPSCGRWLPPTAYDPAISISDATLVNTLGDAALVGKWFIFLKAHWLQRSGMDALLATSGISGAPKPTILFRGQDKEIALPGAHIKPAALPRPQLDSRWRVSWQGETRGRGSLYPERLRRRAHSHGSLEGLGTGATRDANDQ